MSWTDPSVSRGRQLLRKCFYLRATLANGGTKTFTINDQLPVGDTFRVSASGQATATATYTAEVASVLEVRLYNAFNVAHVTDTSSGSLSAATQQYIILGTLSYQISSAGVRNLVFLPSAPVWVNGFSSNVWTVIIYSCDKNAIVTAAEIGSWSFAVDVREGGDLKFLN